MKRFKIFFYPIYLLIAAMSLYYSIDILLHSDGYLERIKDFATLKKIPQYMLVAILIISVLMLVEIIVENIHLFRWRRKAASNEVEITKLKAKLYDQGQPSLQAPPEETENDDEDSDYLGMNDEEEKD